MECVSKYYQRLSELSSKDLLEILHDCVELLQPLSPLEMTKMGGCSKKQIFNRIESGKYMTFNFDGRKYPIVNDHLKGKEKTMKK
jgi:hypothetical protein